MTRGDRLVDTDTLEAAEVVNMQQLIQVLKSLWMPAPMTETSSPCHASTFNGEGGIKLFLRKFNDVTT